jgi:hypothetical protein
MIYDPDLERKERRYQDALEEAAQLPPTERPRTTGHPAGDWQALEATVGGWDPFCTSEEVQ